MTNKKVTQKDFLFLSISFFTIVAAWVAFNIYHTAVTSTISEDLQQQITPIDGTFDTKTLDSLKQRTKIDPNFIVTPLDSPTQPENASEEASLTTEISPSIFPTPTVSIEISEEPTPTETIAP